MVKRSASSKRLLAAKILKLQSQSNANVEVLELRQKKNPELPLAHLQIYPAHDTSSNFLSDPAKKSLSRISEET